MMNDLIDWITDYWEEHGFTSETTECIIRDIEEALSEHAISVEITIIEDGNDYENKKKDE